MKRARWKRVDNYRGGLETAGRRAWFVAAVGVLAAAVVTSGCGGGESANTFKMDGLTITMKAPAGWKRGDLKSSGGYKVSATGEYFFADAANDYPSAEVQVIDLLGDTLSEYIRKTYEQEKAMQNVGAKMMGMIGEAAGQMAGGEAKADAEAAKEAMEAAVVTMEEYMIGEQKAGELAIRSDGVRLLVFVESGAKAAMIVFEGENDDFAREEPVIREAIKSIVVK